MKGGYYLPKGRQRYRVWINHQGKKLQINKDRNGKPFYHPNQCEDFLEEIAVEIRRGRFDPSMWGKDKPNLFEKAWIIYSMKNPCKPGTDYNREMICKYYLLPYFKGKFISEITKLMIDDWWVNLPDKKPSYKRLIRAVLRAFLNYPSVKDCLSKEITMPKVKVPRRDQPWLSREEQERVLNCLGREKDIIRFMVLYGCRSSEACNLKKADIDFEKKLITLRNRKNQMDNTLPLLPEAEAIIKGPRKIESLEYVFCDSKGEKFDRCVLYGAWKKANRLSGVKMVSLKNGTRHSLASQLSNRGGSLSDIARILGNTERVVDENYRRINVQRIEEVLGR